MIGEKEEEKNEKRGDMLRHITKKVKRGERLRGAK